MQNGVGSGARGSNVVKSMGVVLCFRVDHINVTLRRYRETKQFHSSGVPVFTSLPFAITLWFSLLNLGIGLKSRIKHTCQYTQWILTPYCSFDSFALPVEISLMNGAVSMRQFNTLLPGLLISSIFGIHLLLRHILRVRKATKIVREVKTHTWTHEASTELLGKWLALPVLERFP